MAAQTLPGKEVVGVVVSPFSLSLWEDTLPYGLRIPMGIRKKTSDNHN